jgi:hypothetical protein
MAMPSWLTSTLLRTKRRYLAPQYVREHRASGLGEEFVSRHLFKKIQVVTGATEPDQKATASALGTGDFGS